MVITFAFVGKHFHLLLLSHRYYDATFSKAKLMRPPGSRN